MTQGVEIPAGYFVYAGPYRQVLRRRKIFRLLGLTDFTLTKIEQDYWSLDSPDRATAQMAKSVLWAQTPILPGEACAVHLQALRDGTIWYAPEAPRAQEERHRKARQRALKAYDQTQPRRSG